MALTDIALEAAQEGWRAQAACRDADVNVFFPPTDEEAGPAKAICAACPVRVECLEFALATRQEDGVWGGMTEIERRRLRRLRQAAARAARAAAAAA
jgi:WhiB family transcriptional regulator, redox-sensing transcriptional regulator